MSAEPIPAASARCWACGSQAPRATGHLAALGFRCPACGLVFEPDRSLDDVRGLYDAGYFADYAGAAYSHDEAQRRHEARVRVRFVRQRAAQAGRLLEIGAASGYFLEAARDAGFDVFGVEPSEGVAAEARARGLDVVTGFLEDVKLAPGSFDVACAWHVVEHLVEPRGALEQVRATLKPGGRLLVEVPNLDSVHARRMGPAWPHLDPEHHVAHYTPRALRALLQSADFAVEQVDTFPNAAYFRPARAWNPKTVAWYVREAARLRTSPRHPHPDRHELLRAVARAGG